MCDAFHQIRLAVQKQQQTGDHIDDSGGKGDADLAGVDAGQEHRKRLLLHVVEQDQRLFDHVPVVDKHQDRNGIEGAPALRQADVPEDVPLVRAVDLGRFDDSHGDAAHEFGEQKDRERRKRAGQEDRPPGIEDLQPVAHQIVWDQRDLIRHEHQDHIEEEQTVAHLPAPAGKAIGRDGRDHELREDDRRGQDDGVPEFQQIVRAFEQDGEILGEADLVGDEFEFNGLGDVALAVVGVFKDLAVAGRDLALRHEGVRDGQNRRQQKQQREHRAEQKADRAGKIAFFLHPSTSFPKMFSTKNKRAMRMMMTIASSTAAADRRW